LGLFWILGAPNASAKTNAIDSNRNSRPRANTRCRRKHYEGDERLEGADALPQMRIDATIRGRVGYAWDRLLVYGTAGGAFADVQAAAGVLPFMSSTQAGWTAGVGLEYAVTPNWSAKVEYLFVDLGNVSCGAANCGGTTTTVSLNENVVRGGFNYRFGWW
jgi:opacity protein-like surface antigen